MWEMATLNQWEVPTKSSIFDITWTVNGQPPKGRSYGADLAMGHYRYSEKLKHMIFECMYQRPNHRPDLIEMKAKVERCWRMARELERAQGFPNEESTDTWSLPEPFIDNNSSCSDSSGGRPLRGRADMEIDNSSRISGPGGGVPLSSADMGVDSRPSRRSSDRGAQQAADQVAFPADMDIDSKSSRKSSSGGAQLEDDQMDFPADIEIDSQGPLPTDDDMDIDSQSFKYQTFDTGSRGSSVRPFVSSDGDVDDAYFSSGESSGRESPLRNAQQPVNRLRSFVMPFNLPAFNVRNLLGGMIPGRMSNSGITPNWPRNSNSSVD